MNKEFIPYEQALELKELGFDEPCIAGINVNSFELKMVNYNSELYLPTPLYQQPFRWFREKHNLHFYCFEVNIPYPDDDYPNKVWVGKINDNYVNTQNGLAINHFHTYEEAELACLKKLIEITKIIEIAKDKPQKEGRIQDISIG
jgi:hypothetical protein